MNYLQSYIEFTTPEEGINKLIEAVAIRDQMGGAMYWNILNEDCCAIASKAAGLGADRARIKTVLGEGTFV